MSCNSEVDATGEYCPNTEDKAENRVPPHLMAEVLRQFSGVLHFVAADVEPQEFLNRPAIVSFKGRPRQLDEHNRRQHINAINGDRVIEFAFRSLEANFGIQFHPYSMYAHTAFIESSRVLILTTRLQSWRLVAIDYPIVLRIRRNRFMSSIAAMKATPRAEVELCSIFIVPPENRSGFIRLVKYHHQFNHRQIAWVAAARGLDSDPQPI